VLALPPVEPPRCQQDDGGEDNHQALPLLGLGRSGSRPDLSLHLELSEPASAALWV